VVNTTPEAREPVLSVHSGDTVVVGWRHPGEIRGQRLAVTGDKVGAEFLVNTSAAGAGVPPDIGNPAVDGVGGGRVFAVWSDGLGGELRGQLFDEAAAKVGGDVLVGALADAVPGDDGAAHSSVAGLQGAGIVVGWTGAAADPAAGAAPRVQLLRMDGSRLGGSLAANTTTDGRSFAPHVASLPSPVGGFVVVWVNELGVDSNALRGQLFALDDNGQAAPSGGELEIAGNVDDPRIKGVALTGLTDGRFVAAWIHDDPHNKAVRGKLVNLDGSTVDLFVSAQGEGPCREPTVEKLSGGGFVAAWTRDQLGGGDQLRARVFNADGSAAGGPLGGTLTVADSAGGAGQRNAAVAALTGDRFVIAWADTENIAVRARAFTI
jgi:hypothetical protein